MRGGCAAAGSAMYDQGVHGRTARTLPDVCRCREVSPAEQHLWGHVLPAGAATWIRSTRAAAECTRAAAIREAHCVPICMPCTSGGRWKLARFQSISPTWCRVGSYGKLCGLMSLPRLTLVYAGPLEASKRAAGTPNHIRGHASSDPQMMNTRAPMEDAHAVRVVNRQQGLIDEVPDLPILHGRIGRLPAGQGLGG